jgi:hypothetical protein
MQKTLVTRSAHPARIRLYTAASLTAESILQPGSSFMASEQHGAVQRVGEEDLLGLRSLLG